MTIMQTFMIPDFLPIYTCKYKALYLQITGNFVCCYPNMSCETAEVHSIQYFGNNYSTDYQKRVSEILHYLEKHG